MSKALYKALAADFPPEALSTDSSRGFDLTSVKAQYIVERLNTVLGVDGWTLTGEYVPVENGGIMYFSQLGIRTGNEDGQEAWHHVEGIGFSAKKKNMGDTYKGARTDALSKSASMLGVANEVFKGNVTPPSKSGGSKPKAAAGNKPIARPGGKSLF